MTSNASLELLATATGMPADELERATETLFGALGVDSLTATRVRGLFDPQPTYQILNGMTVARVVEGIRASLDRGQTTSPKPSLDSTQSHPLTPMQESYVLGAQQDLPCIVYHEFDVLNLNIRSFQEAVRSVVEEEPMLSAVLVNGSRQSIGERRNAELPVAVESDGPEDPEDRRRKYVDALLEVSHRHWIVELTQLHSGATRIHFALDMLFVDAASAVKLCQRVAAHYRSLVRDRRLLPPPGAAHKFFEHCDELASRRPSSVSLEYWTERCEEFPGPPQLPRSKQNMNEKHSFARESVVLDSAHWGALKECAKSRQITPNSLLLAAFAEAIRLYSAESRFAIAVTTSNRPVTLQNDYSETIGEFTDVTLCSATKRLGESVVDSAIGFHEQLTRGMEHGDVSGLEFIRMLRQQRGDAHLSFPVVFTSFLGIIKGDLGLADTVVTLNYQSTQTPQISLDCQVYEVDGELTVNWDYDASIFASAQMAEMLKCYQRLLRGLAFDINHPAVLDATVLELRNRLNQTYRDRGEQGSRLLHESVLDAAVERPQAVAIIDHDVEITYRSMIVLANAVAVKLQENGVRRGSSVAVLQEKGWEQVVSVIGVLLAGAHYIPLNASDPIERIRTIVGQSNCPAMLTHGPTVALGMDASEAAESSHPICVVDVDMHIADGIGARHPYPTSAAADDLAYIIFTSGSTGVPKGVETTHAGAVNTCLDINEKVAGRGKVVTFGISALSFDLSVWDIFGTLGAGGTLVTCKPDGTRDPDYWRERLAMHHVSVWNSVPTSFEMLLASRGGPELLLGDLGTVLLSGDAISMALANRALQIQPELRLYALGGATEASIWSNYHLVTTQTKDLGTDLVPYGRPLSNQTMHVLNEELGYTPDGVIGEIHIGGRGLARGYFDQPVLTATSFIQTSRFGRLYKTGDLGRYLGNGEIEILGRKDSQVKIGGHRVELSEVEVCAEQLHEVTKAAVIRVSEPSDGIVGFVATPHPSEALESRVRKHIDERLPAYMSPQVWILLEEIPVTANSKVDVKRLREIAHNAEPVAPVDIDNTGVVEEILYHTASVLNVAVDALSAERTFAEQGLTSLYAVQLANRLRDAWDTHLPYPAIFNYPSAGKLAAYRVAAQVRSGEELVAPQRREMFEGSSDEPIAVIASACRLPGDASSVDEFWQMLTRGEDCMSDIPDSRFDIGQIYSAEVGTPGGSYSRRGAFISGADLFDHEFFGIPLAEVQSMDPQQRLLLEVSYEAFYAAGYTRETLRGSSTGVFVGQMNYDWMMDFGHSKEYASTGVAPAITSNRVSFALDLAGPSMTIDTACSSSLVAIDLAVEKLRNNSCRVALVGGSNLILSPEPYVFTSQARMLSVDSRCATFDESANGMARGEGVGAVVLKRLSDAVVDGDRVLAVIRGTAV
ncbi:amino acid adenylation domain-containing protein, partial [Nocardia sp. NPDC058518]|uniref:amino acid adenylation domain-containing protein n=1 Tax=Nocardia sp. NPDC058518 TaxID=3346534 RepID=UPI003653E9E5